MKNKIILIIILLGSNVILSQLPLPNTNISNNIFTKTGKQFNKSKSISSIDYYPLNNGDFWEYNVIDTSFSNFGVFSGLNFSETREVIKDTMMSNGITYKTIKWEKCANSVNESPRYEFQRKDTSGHVFIFFNGVDKLLYDFSINIKGTYPSHYPGLHWKLLKKYTVFLDNSYLFTVDYALLDSNDIIKKSVTMTQNFGLLGFKGDVNGGSSYPDGSFFGGVIKDSTYGYLLVKKQQIDWSEFYPLHVGDFWKYGGNIGSIPTLETRIIIKDTIINNKTYKKIKINDLTFGNSGYKYHRYENRTVYEFHLYDSSEVVLYKFSSCLGDTTTFINGFVWRVDDKNNETIKFFLYPDISFFGIFFSRGLGLIKTTGDQSVTNLVGSVINGVVFGDTTLTGIEKEKAGIITNYKLFQNYPNPFNPSTTIKYQIVSPNFVTLKIYDVLGREIETLINQYQNAGRYNVTFNAKGLSSGIYIYVLKSGNYLESKKLILLK